jgi:hypothetical protein
MADRKLRLHEKHHCFVGSGECLRPATWEIDDGSGGREYICDIHKPQFDAVEKAVDEMSPDQVFKFAEAIERAHRTPLN